MAQVVFPAEPPQSFVVPRDGDLDLEFHGWRLGVAEHVSSSGYETTVSIYLTNTGRLIASVIRSHPSERDDTDYDAVVVTIVTEDEQVTAGPEQILRWLKEDTNGKLGPVSKEAWTAACTYWAPLKAFATERV